MFILGKYPYANPARLQLKSPACIQSVMHDGNIASYRSRKKTLVFKRVVIYDVFPNVYISR